MKSIKTSIAFIFIMLTLVATSYSQTKVKAFIEKCQLKFKLNYTNPKDWQELKFSNFADPFIKPFNSNSQLQNVSSISFFSKKKHNGVRLRFDIYVYEYRGITDASAAYKNISSGTGDKELIFDKDYDYISLNNNIIIRINANCVYSQSAWKLLVKDVLLIQAEFITNSQLSMECNCGLGCR